MKHLGALQPGGTDLGALQSVPAASSSSYSITGDITTTFNVAATLAKNSHYYIPSNIQTSIIPSATMLYTANSAGYSITGDVTTSLTPSATTLYTAVADNYGITGDVTVSIGVGATMQYQQHPSISGSNVISFTPSATLAYTDNPGPQNYHVNGSTTIDIGVAATVVFTDHTHEISGSTTLSITPNATTSFSGTVNAGGKVLASWRAGKGNRDRIMAEDADLLAFIKGNMSAFMRGRK